jgi:hypothetical protein
LAQSLIWSRDKPALPHSKRLTLRIRLGRWLDTFGVDRRRLALCDSRKQDRAFGKASARAQQPIEIAVLAERIKPPHGRHHGLN